MKIIHTADLHLESKMGVNLDNDKAKKRRNELLFTFENFLSGVKWYLQVFRRPSGDYKNSRPVLRKGVCQRRVKLRQGERSARRI